MDGSSSCSIESTGKSLVQEEGEEEEEVSLIVITIIVPIATLYYTCQG